MALISESKLNFWVENKYNVLFRGKHGVGKTHLITQTFDRHGLRWLYFSAATMDPWVDFIGVPKEKQEGELTYLDLVRPKAFQTDSVDAIFFDELNRAPKKVRNAVMELMQFKSINGKKFNNLKMIWAAINPESEDDTEIQYDVEAMDPAQIDRFHIIYDVPFRPDIKYLADKHGSNGKAAVDWWTKLPSSSQQLISPRRLDYILDIHKAGGDIRDALAESNKINTKSLIDVLNNGSVSDRLRATFDKVDEDSAKNLMSNTNFLDQAFDEICKENGYLTFFAPHMHKDYLVSKLFSDKKATLAITKALTPDFIAQEVRMAMKSKPKTSKEYKEIIKILNKWLQTGQSAATIIDHELITIMEECTSSANTYKRQGLLDCILDNKDVITLAMTDSVIENITILLMRSNPSAFEKRSKTGLKMKLMSAISIVTRAADPTATTDEVVVNKIIEKIQKGIHSAATKKSRIDMLKELYNLT